MKRLLIVVDGDASSLYYSGILLQRLEYTIFTTKLAEEALEIMRISQPALVLTEATLPQMDSLELLKRMKTEPGIASVPVLIMSPSDDPSLRANCMKQGAAAFLARPVEPEVLYATIQKLTETAPRGFIRLTVQLNVIVGDKASADATAPSDCVTALSENGMYVTTHNPRMVGTRLPMTMLLDDRQIRVEGSVLYSFQRGQGPLRLPGMGVKFVHIEPEDQSAIRSFIKRQLTHDITR